MPDRINVIDDKFDVNWYEKTYRSQIPTGMTAREHYSHHGENLGFYKNERLALADHLFRTFDPDWYLSTYKDVAASGQNPWYHFFVYGYREGRKANETEGKTSKYRTENFDENWYVHTYADVLSSGFDPLEHYLLHGRGEGRAPNASEATRLKNTVYKPNVELAYIRLIGRNPSSDELEYWSEQMLQGLPFEKFFAHLANS